MREIFTEIFESQPLDPMQSARRGARPQLRKRFYERAHVGEPLAGGAGQTRDNGFPLLLDGKPVRTPARRALITPVLPLAQVIAQEWNLQVDVIDPARMPLTRLANVVIDTIAQSSQLVSDEIAKYLGSDLLCYRADAPPGLVDRQSALWNPVLDWARDALGARFVQVEGVVFAVQPEGAIAAARAAIPKDAWRLGAVASITTITGSALLALALNAGVFAADVIWAAAHVDEDWQMSQWGRDEQALERRVHRFAEFEAAAMLLALLKP